MEYLSGEDRRELADLAQSLKDAYDTMEELYPKWRKAEVPDYLFDYLSKAQEECMTARGRILELLGAT